MKNIKKFENFEINESSRDLLKNASKGLREMGKSERSNKLEQWALIKDTYKFGTFNLYVASGVTNLDWRGQVSKNGKRIDYFNVSKINNKGLDIYKYEDIKYPTEAYLCNLFTNHIQDDDWQENYEELTDMKKIPITTVFEGIDVRYRKESQIMPFTILINIEWNTDVQFVVTGIELENGWSDLDSELGLFTDRKSALSFRKNILNEKVIKDIFYDEFWKPMKDFFFEYSTAKEFEKTFDLLSKMSLNLLCRD